MFNAYLEQTQIELPLESTDLCKVDVVNFPIVGSLFRKVTFGFGGAGWSASNVNRPKFPYFNCLIPKVLYDNYTDLFVDTLNKFWRITEREKDPSWNSSGKTPPDQDGTIPFEMFYKGAQDGIGVITGSNAITQSYCGSLTHMLRIQAINNNNLKQFFDLATSEIQQDIKGPMGQGGTFLVPLISEKTRIMPYNTTNSNTHYHDPLDPVVGYVIDYFELNHFSRADYQVKFFAGNVRDPNVINEVSDDDCV